MKLAPLLVQYLYTHKRLDLPGIGTFLITETVYTEPEKHKHDKQAGHQSISFESNTSIKESPDLVQYIADHTDKIKALALADLESHLELALQFLNIGNPFLFEGIGILEKIKPGEFTFIPGQWMKEKTKEYLSREKTDIPDSRESFSGYKTVIYSDHVKKKWGNPVVLILIIAGLALAVWGGYIVYKRTTAGNNSGTGDKNKKEETVPVKDSVMNQKDSVVIPVQITPASPSQKFQSLAP